MITLNFRFFMLIPTVLFFCSVISATPAYSKTLIKIVDQNNAPLSNAIVEYTDLQPAINQFTDDHIYVMDQINKEFSPHVLIVPVNSLVSFPNSDDIRHHVYSFSAAKTFELKLYSGKPKSPVRFDEKGVVVMGCNIHDSMVGYIYVTDSQNIHMSNAKGEITLAHPINIKTQLQVWHPNSTLGLSKHKLFTIDQNMLKNNTIELMLSVNDPEPTGSFEELTFDGY